MERPRSRAMSSSSIGSVSDRGAPGSVSDQSDPGTSTGSVKRATCRHWASKGHCDLGNNCNFAHESQDMAQSTTSTRTKTVLCANYATKGTCQYGDSCNFAHGESELRSSTTTPTPHNYKTKLCKTFSSGVCPAGASCHFAHGSRELRNMFKTGGGYGQSAQQHHGSSGGWPAANAKTVLCKNWSEKGSCTYGDSCNFAHGEEQIRGVKEVKIISRNPLYKTTMCKQFSEAEFCELGEECHFAHGQDELRVVRGGGVATGYSHGGHYGYGGHAGRAGGQYKTIMCKQWSEGKVCQYGVECLYAHGPGELREFTVPESKAEYKTVLCKNWEKDGKCEWGEQCKWAHGKEDLQAGHSRAGMGWNSQYKTVVCTKWEEGKCEYGPKCMFAHGQAELRKAQHRAVITSPQYKTVLCQQDPCQFADSCTFAHNQGELRTVQQNLAEINPNYKGTLCKFFMSTGECEFGSICQYAHGNLELRNTGTQIGGPSSKQRNHNYSTTGITSPQYKTTLCKNYQESGLCEFGARCQFAHGQLELRTLAQNYLQLNPQYKTTPCSHYTEHGTCPQGHNCQFSHGVQELRQVVVDRVTPIPVKTTLCKVWLQTGVCRNRATCGAAHGQNELSHGGGGGDVGGGYKPQPGRPSGDGSSGYKTQPCRNMKDTGHCSYGTRCQFAHSYQEMSAALNIGGGPSGHSSVPAGARHGVPAGTRYGVPGGAQHGAHSGGPGSGRPVKVVLCQQYNQTGHCERRDACTFAHGVQELHFYRAKQVPNYKTSLCQSWESSGQCSYGETCMYAHGRSQLRAVQVQDRNKDNDMDLVAQPCSKRIRM